MAGYCNSKALFWGIFLTVALVNGTQLSHAQVQPFAGAEVQAPDKVVELTQTRLDPAQVSDQTPSAKSLTIPGGWWANRLFGDKMVVNWFAYRRTQDSNSQVRLIVRSDLWSRYTTIERYSFLNRFGRMASAAGYHLLVLDRQNFPLGAHVCQFPPHTQPYVLYPWTEGVTSPSALKPQFPCRVWVSPVYGTQSF